jgi:hypothetical protein
MKDLVVVPYLHGNNLGRGMGGFVYCMWDDLNAFMEGVTRFIEDVES